MGSLLRSRENVPREGGSQPPAVATAAAPGEGWGPLRLGCALSFLFLLPSLEIGLFISTVEENQAQPYQMAFFVILPSILLSGFIFPREAMPAVMYYLGFLTPMTYFLDILRGIILRGAGLTHLWPNALALVAFGVVILTLSAARFQKRLA